MGWGAPGAPAEAVNIARAQLETFLAPLINLSGAGGYANFKETLRKLQDYFPRTIELDRISNVWKQAQVLTLSTAAQPNAIKDAIAFLSFYKALTEILRNFNESAAGFSFESFLAVLLGGEQFPTGSGTIADLKDNEGTYISLKLLREGGQIKGSYRDLVNDLVRNASDPDFKMHYLICLKDIRGEGLTSSGFIRFYKFYFSADNFASILSQSGTTKNYLQLPESPDGGIWAYKNGQLGKYTKIAGKWQWKKKGVRGMREAAEPPISQLDTSTDPGKPYSAIVADNMAAIVASAKQNLIDLIADPTKMTDDVVKMGRFLDILTPTLATTNEIAASLQSLPLAPASNAPSITDFVNGANGWLKKTPAPVGGGVDELVDYYMDRSNTKKQTPNIVHRAATSMKAVGYDMSPKSDNTLKNQMTSYLVAGLVDYLDSTYGGVDANGQSTNPLKNAGAKMSLESLELAITNLYNAADDQQKALARTALGVRGKQLKNIVGTGTTGFRRLTSNIIGQLLNALVRSVYNPIEVFYAAKWLDIDDRKVSIERQAFASADDSIALLRYIQTRHSGGAQGAQRLPDSLKTLMLTSGYINKKEWKISSNQFAAGMAATGATLNESTEEETPLHEAAPPSSEYGYVGTLYVGVENVVAFAKEVRKTLDAKIFDVFRDLDTMTCHLEKFYASGLTETAESAEATIDAQKIIQSLTEIENPATT